MPSLIRLLIAIAIMVGGLYGGAYALVALYEPEPREMSHSIPNRELRLEAVPDPKPNLAAGSRQSEPVARKE